MVMTLKTENITCNKWFPEYRGKPLYPTPQSVLRESLNEVNYKFVCEGPDTDYIRAAVVLPLNIPFSHLLNEPWVLNFRATEWRMLIASCEDPVRWIELAKSSGAIAWQRGHAKTFTYKWEMPPLDATGNKIRPANAMGITGKVARHDNGRAIRDDYGVAKKYNKEDMLDDLRHGYLNHEEIGEKHGVSRATVWNTAKRAGIKGRVGNPHNV